MEQVLPSGKVAFYISPQNGEIYYSVVNVVNRYADGFAVIELPRGDPDDFYISTILSEGEQNYRVPVERSKEKYALDKLGIKEEGSPLEILARHGYRYERTESLEEAAIRELEEEHGFDVVANKDMIKQNFFMRPFPVDSSYGSKTEYRSFAWIEGDLSKINIKVTPKTETKSAARLNVPYTETGGWASLREIMQNVRDFESLCSQHHDKNSRSEAGYQKSIAEWLERAEAAIVGLLGRQRVHVNTVSRYTPEKSIRITGATCNQSLLLCV